MPIPTAGLLKRPLMTMTLRLIGASGLSDRLNVIPASAPFAHQWLPLMPLPMNSTANRFGSGSLALEAPATAGSDSIHGNATVAPQPQRTQRTQRTQRKPDCSLVSSVSLVSFVVNRRSNQPFFHKLSALSPLRN